MAVECEGHYDDDFALTSGAGIGEPVFCNGACVPSWLREEEDE